jgi:hypothetical protein
MVLRTTLEQHHKIRKNKSLANDDEGFFKLLATQGLG